MWGEGLGIGDDLLLSLGSDLTCSYNHNAHTSEVVGGGEGK